MRDNNLKNQNYSKVIYFFGMVFLIVFLSSCSKKENEVRFDHDNTAILMSNSHKSGTLYNVTMVCGHLASQCPNGCVTTEVGTVHVNCQGWGHTCTRTASLSVVPAAGGVYTATTQDSTDLTSDPYFNMPARSLYTGMDDSGLPRWLNIPAQFVLRDSTTRLFIFNGVFFSQQQVYKNQ